MVVPTRRKVHVLCCAVLCCAALRCAALCCAGLGWAGLDWAVPADKKLQSKRCLHTSALLLLAFENRFLQNITWSVDLSPTQAYNVCV